MSASLHMAQQFAKHRRLRLVVAVLYVAVVLVYLGWRLTILNPGAPLLSAVYYAADVIGFVLGLTVIVTSRTYVHRSPPAAPAGLGVDVFVLCYREPVDLVRTTLRAARDLRYPHATWLLDDGNREEMRRLAEDLGVGYLRRTENIDAKAGNLNHGLANTSAEFVAVFDADHVAQPHALDVMLGFFSDPALAMVQTPQDYYNTDAFQYMNSRRSGALWHDQSFFYGIALPCAEAGNGATCVGTSVVYRRSAIDTIGGIPTETVTEDLHTSLRLHKAGFRTVYLHEPVAYGVAAADIAEYYKTRHRWAHGNIHALRIENAAFTTKLSLSQRLSYISLGVIYLEGWQQLMMFTIPVVTLMFGLAPFEISVFNVLVVLLMPLVTFLLLQELGCGFTRYWVNEIFSMARFPVHIAAAAALWRKKMAWRTSTKATKGRVSARLLAPQIAVAVASLGAVAVGVWRLSADWSTGPLTAFVVATATGDISGLKIGLFETLREGYPLDLVAVAGFWAVFNAVRAGAVVAKAVRNARRSSDQQRFPVPLPITLAFEGTDITGVTEAVTFSSAEIVTWEPVPSCPSSRAACTLWLPDGPLRTEAAVLALPDRRGVHRAQIAFASREVRDRLENTLLSVDWHREALARHRGFHTALGTLGDLARLKWPFRRQDPSWTAALLDTTGTPSKSAYGLIGAPPGGGHYRSLIAFRELECGQMVRATTFDSAACCSITMSVLGEEATHCLNGVGLDGAEMRRYFVRLEA